MSTSSASLQLSAKDFFHSSMKGPLELSLAMTPTFFWMAAWLVAKGSLEACDKMTHTCRLDGVCNFDEELLVRLVVFSPDEHLDGNPPTLDLI
jgi:hypothetical protein